MNLEETVCLNQLVRPDVNLKDKFHGDCRICEKDINNIFCEGYYPIKIFVFNVENKKTEYEVENEIRS